jgi:hypothetical protein
VVKTAKKAKSNSKPSRKEIKQADQFIEVSTKSLDWATTYRSQIIGGFIAVIAVAFVVFAFFYWQDQKNASATKLMGEALAVYQGKVTKDENAPTDGGKTFKSEEEKQKASLEAFEKVRNTYPGTKMSAFASLYIGHIRNEQKKYNEAVEAYKRFLSGISEEEPLRFLGVDALAYALSQSKKEEEAIQKLKDFGHRGATSFQAFALQRVAEYYEGKGDITKALHFYRQISKDKVNKELQKQAERRAMLLASASEKAAPASTPTAPPKKR